MVHFGQKMKNIDEKWSSLDQQFSTLYQNGPWSKLGKTWVKITEVDIVGDYQFFGRQKGFTLREVRTPLRKVLATGLITQ